MVHHNVLGDTTEKPKGERDTKGGEEPQGERGTRGREELKGERDRNGERKKWAREKKGDV